LGWEVMICGMSCASEQEVSRWCICCVVVSV